jgi:hypothetical protein
MSGEPRSHLRKEFGKNHKTALKPDISCRTGKVTRGHQHSGLKPPFILWNNVKIMPPNHETSRGRRSLMIFLFLFFPAHRRRNHAIKNQAEE